MNKNTKNIKQLVKAGYGKIAQQGSSCCSTSSCCGNANLAKNISKTVGYSDEEMNVVPQEANLGLGCGNPVAIASLKEGEVVLDLGSGAGFDAFLVSSRVGPTGRVIGVDMTPEMVKKAGENAKKGNYKNVEFRLGEIEKLPIEDNSVDVIISNCVINLSPEKQKVFEEAFRVLKPGGRLMISDLVLVKELPDSIKQSVEAYIGCLAGAVMKDEYIRFIENAGFRDIRIVNQSSYPVDAMVQDKDINNIANSVVSIKIHAVKS
jgi:ubiquinone/menaquinone biosynthesis C-methylase UbiE